MLRREERAAARTTGAPAPALSTIVHTLQSLGWSERSCAPNSASAIVKRCAGTLKQLDCCFWEKNNDNWNEALAGCTRLESLTDASKFAPAAWLGLSQLHTLLDVDVHFVSVATIAAALPRLHTFGIATHHSLNPSAVDGFSGMLLPRLRSFRFHGPKWHVEDTTPAQAPLPLLGELILGRALFADTFSLAQPVTLHASESVIQKWATCAHHAASGCSPLCRVRDLRFCGEMPNAATVAAVLRAAPELRALHGGRIYDRVWGWCNDPAFDGLVHRKLRSLRFSRHFTEGELFAGIEFDTLQARHFPRLRALTMER
jgi:hypothetical protein